MLGRGNKLSLLQPFLTKRNWIYCQRSLHDKTGRRKGYPMFFPDDNGERRLFGRSYTKHVCGKNHEGLEQPYPLFTNIEPWVVDIPDDQIKAEADLKGSFLKWIEIDDARTAIVRKILDESGVPIESVGIGGSSAFGQFRISSDVDIIIYGKSHVLPCLETVRQLIDLGILTFSTVEQASRMANRYSSLYNDQIDFKKAFQLFIGDCSKCHFNEQKISLIFAYADNEKSLIPSVIFNDGDETEISGTIVSDESDGWLFPRKYLVEAREGKVWEVWTHHWYFKAVAIWGERVSVRARQVSDNHAVISSLNHFINPF